MPKFVNFPLGRQGKLFVDGVMHSTCLFDTASGIYVSSIQYSLDVPKGIDTVSLADDGERIEFESITLCPVDAQHHFTAA